MHAYTFKCTYKFRKSGVGVCIYANRYGVGENEKTLLNIRQKQMKVRHLFKGQSNESCSYETASCLYLKEYAVFHYALKLFNKVLMCYGHVL